MTNAVAIDRRWAHALAWAPAPAAMRPPPRCVADLVDGSPGGVRRPSGRRLGATAQRARCGDEAAIISACGRTDRGRGDDRAAHGGQGRSRWNRSCGAAGRRPHGGDDRAASTNRHRSCLLLPMRRARTRSAARSRPSSRTASWPRNHKSSVSKRAERSARNHRDEERGDRAVHHRSSQPCAGAHPLDRDRAGHRACGRVGGAPARPRGREGGRPGRR